MGATRIIAVRHGETAWNVDTRIQGQLDIGLNDRGLWQAQRVGQALADEAIDHIYSSDLQRASATADQLARLVDLPVRLDPRLRETDGGTWEGRTSREIAAAAEGNRAVETQSITPGHHREPVEPVAGDGHLEAVRGELLAAAVEQVVEEHRLELGTGQQVPVGLG